MSIQATKKFCLIGHPLSHSMSKFIHTALFEYRGLPYIYDVVDIDPNSFDVEIKNIFEHYQGLNVTIPYKSQIIPHLTSLSGKADIYQSVNTVKADNQTIGYNTDCEGFLKSLESRHISLNGKAVILGSGGVARTFAFEAALAGCEVINVCQEGFLDTSQAIGAEIKQQVPHVTFTTMLYNELEELAKNRQLLADIIINATPVGMFPHIDEAPISEATVKCAKIVYDAVYNPRETALMKTANNLGLTVIGGMDMLVWQAEMAQRIWFGDSVDEKLIAELINKTQDEMERKFQ